MAIAAPVLLVLILLAPVTWARNAEWSDDIRLFESDLKKSPGHSQLLRVLTGALLRERKHRRVVALCEANSTRIRGSTFFANHCAIAYGRLGKNEKAEEAYKHALLNPDERAATHANLARHYLKTGRRSDAEEHFRLAVENERDPAMRAYRTGMMIAVLYPSDPDRLLEARAHFEEALRLNPAMTPARQWLELNKSAKESKGEPE